MFSLYSQERDLFYSFTETKDTISFTQLLTWDDVSYAKSYDVILEKENELGNWELYEMYSVESNSLEISLNHGRYRYNTSVLNPLNRKEPASDWYEFEILEALKPNITSLEPQKWYLSENKEGLLYGLGADIQPEAVISLNNSGTNSKIPVTMLPSEDGKYAFSFDETLLEKGQYTLNVINPSGLYDSSTQLGVFLRPPQWLYLSGGYSPIMAIPGGTLEPFFRQSINYIGGNIKIGTLPIVLTNADLGLELKMGVHIMNSLRGNNSLSMLVVPFILSFVYQSPVIGDKGFLDFSIGGGITYFNLSARKNSSNGTLPLIPALTISPSVGLAFQYKLFDGFFIELGVESEFHILLKNTYFHTISSTFGISYKF